MAAARKKSRLDDPGDLAQVYADYTPELKGYIARRVNSLEEAEDILHDVFYNLSKIDLGASPIEYLSAWLYRATLNRILDRRRKKREEALPEVRDCGEDDYFMGALSDFLASESDEPEAILRSEMIRERIAGALAELPAGQRSIFELTEYEGFSYKEISESTGLPVSTLLTRKYYAVEYLRKKLYPLWLDLTGR